MFREIGDAYKLAHERKDKADKIRRKEAENVHFVRYHVRVDGRKELREAHTNSANILKGIPFINKVFGKKRKTRDWEDWKVSRYPINDEEELKRVQDSNGGCVKLGKVYKVDEDSDGDDDKRYLGVWATTKRKLLF